MTNYIRVQNGEAVGEPITEAKLLQDNPGININVLPPEFARLIKVHPPKLSPYEKNQVKVYEWDRDAIKEVWYCEQVTPEEKLQLQNNAKAKWAQIGFPSWVFDESICWFKPPVPKPMDGKIYRWDEQSLSWKLLNQ
jgi:hypothetical protein